jgi:GMP synthase (glutamine-hydrolysing)
MKKILVLDLCYEKNSIFQNEFVLPVTQILKSLDVLYDVKHFLESYCPDSYSHIILCGVALKDFEYLNHVTSFSWIKDSVTPVLGICAGAQVISLLYEESLRDDEEIGLTKVNCTTDDIILKGCSFPLEVYTLHNKGIYCGSEFIELLENGTSQMIKHRDKKIYACLFHPEVRNKNIIENFLQV